MADTNYSVLNENAITVADPSRVLLISIAHAGNRLVAVGEHGVIVYSDDNGQTWHQAVVPVRVTITSVAFATPLVGWAGADYGLVLHTTDGGLTWTKQIMGAEINQLMVANATQFLATNPNDPKAQMAVRRANILMSAGPDKPILSLVAMSPEVAIAFGAYRLAIATNDGGKTWTDLSLQVADPISHNLYDTAWIGTSLYIAGEAGTVLRSDDQGKTFVLLPTPSENTLFGIFDAGSNIVLAYGVAGAAFESANQGQSWSQVNVPSQSNLTAGITLKSGTILLANEAGNVFLSSDNGKNFHMIPGNQGMGIFGVAQAANGNVVLVGTSGVRVVPLSSLN
ncbi:hypothetical protein GCM10010909_30640 [Acidocella aquatica]|uniref:Photosynthesis system II assembly factor Ycf48/Hcf136-like domain-containing protein n=2 Tax=Acidocella aquatica TaxID=1922313 RepID=A0ABQ6AAP7_9PROT|nr:hypothetical protein GCM10010909_30640 [Acidocella aquatica]